VQAHEVLVALLQIGHDRTMKSTAQNGSKRWKSAINGFAGADSLDFLIIDEDKAFRDRTRILIEGEGHYAESSVPGDLGLARLDEDVFDALFLDLPVDLENGLDILSQIVKKQPRLPVVIFTAKGTVKIGVEAMRRGALDFLEKPFSREQFHGVLARVQRFHRLLRDIELLELEVHETKAQNPDALFDFTAPAMIEVMELLARAAKSPASILLLGESGTGKSVVARAVHRQSHLASKPFVTVSCPSLSKELLISELFGHVKGAFTGAVKDHWGKVKAAAGGTLFLDEIGDLPMEIQPKLLRLLQEREYERLGENVTRSADIRVIAATNRDLKKAIADGTFREDLYFRLNVISTEIPPLRRRQQDIVRFAEHYLAHFAAQCARPIKKFADDALACLLNYDWPGNLRELRNAIERAVIMARGECVIARDFPMELREPANQQDEVDELAGRAGSSISSQKLDELHLRRVIESASNYSEAAQLLGIDRATLYRKRKQLRMD
jgi:NtrC-family two-component system response regulator AlgB